MSTTQRVGQSRTHRSKQEIDRIYSFVRIWGKRIELFLGQSLRECLRNGACVLCDAEKDLVRICEGCLVDPSLESIDFAARHGRGRTGLP